MIEYKYDAYGNIWLNTGKDETDVMHEYGHSVQERLLGQSLYHSILCLYINN